MSIMAIKTAADSVPQGILVLLSRFCECIGGEDVEVTIHDRTNGRDYTLVPDERSEGE